MQIGKVIGQVIATMKTGKTQGMPLLVVQQLNESLQPTDQSAVCTDTVNAKHGEVVLTCSSSSARYTARTKGICTDHSIVAIVDSISSGKRDIYNKHD